MKNGVLFALFICLFSINAEAKDLSRSKANITVTSAAPNYDINAISFCISNPTTSEGNIWYRCETAPDTNIELPILPGQTVCEDWPTLKAVCETLKLRTTSEIGTVTGIGIRWVTTQ